VYLASSEKSSDLVLMNPPLGNSERSRHLLPNSPRTSVGPATPALEADRAARTLLLTAL
jgi:hypothetical protein